MTIAELEILLELYYPKLKSIKLEIWECLCKQGRSNRQEIGRYIDAKMSPFLIQQIEEMVDDSILTKEGNKPMYYSVTYLPMEYL